MVESHLGGRKKGNKHCGEDPIESTLGFGTDQLPNLHELTYYQTKFEWIGGGVLWMYFQPR